MAILIWTLKNLNWVSPELFRENWIYHTAKARLYWDIVDDYYILKSDDITMTAPEGNLKGKLRLDIPLDDPDAPMDMALTVGITEGNARQTPKYLPVYLPMDEGLVEWLDTAIHKADINSAVFSGMVPLLIPKEVRIPAGGSSLMLIMASWITVWVTGLC